MATTPDSSLIERHRNLLRIAPYQATLSLGPEAILLREREKSEDANFEVRPSLPVKAGEVRPSSPVKAGEVQRTEERLNALEALASGRLRGPDPNSDPNPKPNPKPNPNPNPDGRLEALEDAVGKTQPRKSASFKAPHEVPVSYTYEERLVALEAKLGVGRR